MSFPLVFSFLLMCLACIERRMGPNEKPVLLQKRRFEQAGYTELDKLDDLGLEDNSYLCKLVYKPHHASITNFVRLDISSNRFVLLILRCIAGGRYRR